MDWKAPTLVHEVWSFLGLVCYYRCFIPYFSKIAKPMTKLLLKDEKFNWTPECEAAFHTLRTLLTTAPVLAQPNIEKPFDVFYDTSGIGLGGVLMQEGQVMPMLPDNCESMKSTTLHMIWSLQQLFTP